jgi:polyferredoxin
MKKEKGSGFLHKNQKENFITSVPGLAGDSLRFFCYPIYKSKWKAIVSVQHSGKRIYHLWKNFLATRLCHFRAYHGYVYRIHCIVYGSIWSCILWVGVPANYFYGNAFQKSRILDRWRCRQTKVLRNAPWTTQKIWKRLFKHAVFFLLSFIIANTFLAYIIGVDQLKEIITEPISEHVGGFLSILIFSFVFYWIYAFFREQVCTVVCPYGRLQSVLMDRNS